MSPATTGLRHHQPPHVALLPSAGMGHLTPALRLAAMLASHDCHVTLITPQPPVSTAESDHISAFLNLYPTITTLDFQIIPYTLPDAATADPFFLQFESISRSCHLLTPLLSSVSPPLSAIISDIATCGGVTQVADHLSVPHYILSTTSARFTSFVLRLPSLISSITKSESSIHIPGLTPFDISTIPPPFFNPNHIFTKNVLSNAPAFTTATGILSNTFHALEPDTIDAINDGKSVLDLPPFLPIGPLQPHKLELGDNQPISWLDQQESKSVVYVSFGSRIALSRDQISELRKGLEKSGRGFLWVLKSTIVDKQETGEVEGIVGDEFIERTKEKGLVVKGWVNQEQILSHPAIGGFVSHCGWNSVVEAAARGIPVLAWPQLGDQKVNAGVVETAGFGVLDKTWGWMGEKVVKGEEIAEKLEKIMSDEKIRESARKIGEEAKNAIKVGGSSDKVMKDMVLNLLQHK